MTDLAVTLPGVAGSGDVWGSTLNTAILAAQGAVNLSKLVPTGVKTANYAAASRDLVDVDSTSGNVVVTLPTAPADEATILVKHVIQGTAANGSKNLVTVACGGADVFNRAGGGTSLTLRLADQAMRVQYRAASGIWTVVAGDLPLGQLETRFALPLRSGLLGWSCDPATASNSTSLTAGQETLIKVVAETPGTATKVTLGLANTPTGCTSSYAGIRDAAGTLLASTAESSSVINGASGKLTLSLSSSVIVTAGTVYYVVVLIGSATTIPALARGASNSMINDGLGAGAYRVMTAGSGLSSLPSGVTMSGAAASANAFYASVS